ncbi:proline-rich protein 22-like [Phalacrocorax carbo]|uniref:proline-rich protein 22-like n=1 Tax=Phalacrocorax carbo TaxID=9209 RepID=UPI00311A399E
MARPPLGLPPRGSRAAPAPRLLHTFVLPETFSPPGSANLCPLPAQEQPFPAAWAPPPAVATHAPQAPPAGLQRPPRGCFFDPRAFHMQRTTTSLLPRATATLAHGATSLPGAGLWGPGGCATCLAWAAPRTPHGQPQHHAPYQEQRRAVAPASPVQPPSSSGLQHAEGTAAPSACNMPPGTNVPTSPSTATHNQGLGDPAAGLGVSDKELLEEALRLLGCSLDAEGLSQGGPSSGPMPGDPGGTCAEAGAVATASPISPTAIPAYEHAEGQPAHTNIAVSGTPAGAHPGTNIPLGTHVHTSPSAAPHNQPLGDPAADLALPDEVPLHEALRFFGCSMDESGISPEGPSSGPTPGDPGATSAGIPPCDLASLALPEELLSPDYSVPETADATLSLEEFVQSIGLELQEPWGDAGRELPGPQPAMAGARGKKRGKSPLPKAASKRRALAGSTRVAGRD